MHKLSYFKDDVSLKIMLFITNTIKLVTVYQEGK